MLSAWPSYLHRNRGLLLLTRILRLHSIHSFVLCTVGLLIRVQNWIFAKNCLRCLWSGWFSNCKIRQYTCKLTTGKSSSWHGKNLLILSLFRYLFSFLCKVESFMRTLLSVEFEEWPSFALFFNVCFKVVDISCLFFCDFLSLVTRIIWPTSHSASFYVSLIAAGVTDCVENNCCLFVQTDPTLGSRYLTWSENLPECFTWF